MKDRDDFHSSYIGSVEDAVGVARHNRLKYIGENHRIQPRILGDPIEDNLHPRDKGDTQTGSLRLIEIERLVKLSLGLGSEDDWKTHRRARSMARALISSQGVTASGRAILSASRRSSS